MKAIGSASKFRWQDTERSRLEGLRRSLQTTDRILSGGTDINLRFSEYLAGVGAMGYSYAVSIDNDITVNVKLIQHPTSAEGVASILGLNYHELAHVLFSPQKWTDLSSCYSPNTKQRKTLSQHFRVAYMMMEESRVETLMGAKYPNMRKYFAYPIFSIMLKDNTPASVKDRHLLLHGRRFLPRKIRDTYRKFFEQEYGAANAREFERLIDEYRLMPLTEAGQKRHAAGLIQEFAVLLEKCKIIPDEPHMESESGSGGNSSEQKQQKQAAAKQAKQEAKEQDEKEQQYPDADGSGFNEQGGDEDEREDDGSGSDGVSDPEAGDGEADRSDSAEGGFGGGEGDDQDGSGAGSQGSGGEAADGGQSGGSSDVEGSGGKSQGDTGPSERTGPGVGSGKGNPDQIKKTPSTYEVGELKSALKDLVDDILDDEEVSAEIGRYQNAMNDPRAALGSTLAKTPEKKPEYLQTVTPEMLRRSGRIADELRQIWAKMDSGWDYGVSEGPRLNMERASVARDAEDYEFIYDEWEPGQQENSGVEFVILGDRSGSMDSYIFPDGKGYYDLNYDERQALPTLVKMVSQNIWELMYALQEIDAHVTVITYDSESYTFYERGETVTPAGYYELYADGGTQPIQAVNEARRILAQSTQPHKVLINFSDGGWMGSKEHFEDSLDSLTDVVKVVALLGEGALTQFQYKHLFDVVRETSGDILDIMAEVVMEIMRRSIQ